VTTLIFGLTPARGALQRGADATRGGRRISADRRARNVMRGFVALEIALAVVLLAGAGLALRTFGHLMDVAPGFDARGVQTIPYQLPPGRYETPEALEAFYRQAFARVRDVPGVTAVGTGVVVPLTGNDWTVPFERADRPRIEGERAPDVGWQAASRGYFEALRVPLQSGRLFGDEDRPDSPNVVIVSQSLERLYFPDGGAVGKRLRFGDDEATIVGVVGDIRRADLTTAPRPDMYFPFEQSPGGEGTLFVRTEGTTPPGAAVAALRALEPMMLIRRVQSLEDIAAKSIANQRLALWLLGAFGVIAVLLSALGVYGVMAYSVSQRTSEIGIRVALGSSRGDVVRLVLGEGALMAAAGMTAGVALSMVATQSLESLLFGVKPIDPATLAGALALLIAAAGLACGVPAARAAAVDPVRALKGQ
jgi:putative ABC transport system permease protein